MHSLDLHPPAPTCNPLPLPLHPANCPCPTARPVCLHALPCLLHPTPSCPPTHPPTNPSHPPGHPPQERLLAKHGGTADQQWRSVRERLEAQVAASGWTPEVAAEAEALLASLAAKAAPRLTWPLPAGAWRSSRRRGRPRPGGPGLVARITALLQAPARGLQVVLLPGLGRRGRTYSLLWSSGQLWQT